MVIPPPIDLAVYRVSRHAAERVSLIDLLRRAFDRDPHINWLVRQDHRRETALAELFVLLVNEMGGELHATADRQAAALWFPPGGGPHWGAQSRFFLRLLNLAGPLRAVARGIDLKRLDRCHPARPHFHLQLLGVAPECRGQGHGSALVEQLRALARAANQPVYLETSRRENVAFYSRRGFEVAAETRLSEGLCLWSLVSRS
jgi:ribosomal protein S18 acetylase RimI-like enzyme